MPATFVLLCSYFFAAGFMSLLTSVCWVKFIVKCLHQLLICAFWYLNHERFISLAVTDCYDLCLLQLVILHTVFVVGFTEVQHVCQLLCSRKVASACGNSFE